MKDVQSSPDSRRIDIDTVGIKNISYPIILKDRKNGTQKTVAKISMGVHLPHNYKGTHMSRFVEILNDYKDNISIDAIEAILRAMCERLDSKAAFMTLSFPYFIEKSAPISKRTSLMNYDILFDSRLDDSGLDLILKVTVPVQSLCPCSKEISEYGAHNQRSLATISVRYSSEVWIEELVSIAEASASSEIYALLKRQDEKFVTEQAYNNPAFVEDIVRNITERLMEDKRITWFSVECENMESIHNHNAWARLERDLQRR